MREADLARPRNARRRPPARHPRRCDAARGTGAPRPVRSPAAAVRPPSGSTSPPALRRTSAAEGSPRPGAPSSSCPRPAARRGACCDRRRPQSPAPGARASWPCTSAKSAWAVPSVPVLPRVTRRSSLLNAVRVVERADGLGERSRPDTAAVRRRPPLRGRCRAAAAARDSLRAAPPRRPAGRRARSGCRRRATARRSTARRRCRAASIRPAAASTPSAIGRSNDDACLADVGGREVDGDAVRREFEAGVADGAADAVAALAIARVRQSDHRERRQAAATRRLRPGWGRPRCRRRRRCGRRRARRS